MIEGVTLLSTEYSWLPWWGALIFGIFVSAFGVFVLSDMRGDFPANIIFFSAIAIIVGFLLFAIGGFGQKTIKYKVTIDDTVSWQEIEDNYEVIDVDDKIVTIELK